MYCTHYVIATVRLTGDEKKLNWKDVEIWFRSYDTREFEVWHTYKSVLYHGSDKVKALNVFHSLIDEEKECATEIAKYFTNERGLKTSVSVDFKTNYKAMP